MARAGDVVVLYQTALLHPESASCSRGARHQKCCGTDGTSAALVVTQPTQVRNLCEQPRCLYRYPSPQALMTAGKRETLKLITVISWMAIHRPFSK